jgi:hypothetical protein
MVVLFGVLVAMAWGYTQVFTGRAALLHLGAFTATIMSANVAMIIIPNQKVVVADLKAGRTPDPKYGRIAKQRSLHNNYLTLPVIFLMLSNHYPLAFATPYNWLIASLVFLMGVTIRHWFNTVHARKGKPHWTWAATTALFLAVMWLSSLPRSDEVIEEASLAPVHQQFIDNAHFQAVSETVMGRCSMCHAAEPFWDGIARAPKDVKLETEADIARHAREIYLQAGRSHAMPPGNITYIEPGERRLIVAWYESAVAGSRLNDGAAAARPDLELLRLGHRRETMKQAMPTRKTAHLLIEDGLIMPRQVPMPRSSASRARGDRYNRSPPVSAAARLYRSAYPLPANAGDGELCRQSAGMAQHLHIRRGTKVRRSEHAERFAKLFFDELLRQGTTTAAAYCSVHKGSADAFFAGSRAAQPVDGRRQGDDGPQCARCAHRHRAIRL